MPSVTPFGEKIQSLRKALGLTQLDLALRAGVSERTVRNAERGRPLKREFLGFLAAALGVDIRDLVRKTAEIQSLLAWQQNVATATELFDRVTREGDSSMLRDYMQPNIALEFHSDPRLVMGGLAHEFTGILQGIDGAQCFVDLIRRFDSRVLKRKLVFEKPLGDGDSVILHGLDHLTYVDGQQDQAWWFYVFDFENRRIVRAREYNGVLSGWPADARRSEVQVRSA